MYTANDYMTTGILDGVYDEQMRVKQVVADLLYRTVAVEKPDTSGGVYTVPFADLINVVENNIDRFAAGGYTPSTMLPTVRWKGELADLRRFSYLDVNRWFDSLEKLELLAYAIAYRGLITGNFSTGNDRARQILRSVN